MYENLTPALEDYLETILQLTEENGKATISEIARRLKISKPSANQAINHLRGEGLVSQERYGPVYLTEAGKQKAEQVWHQHQIIRNFLHDVLKVSGTVAERDACMIEHVISAETLTAMSKFLSDLHSGKLLDSKTDFE
jgi:DtxR family Mn-dependent transcriptional regulator